MSVFISARPHSRWRRTATVIAATAAAMVLGAGAAFAHVSVNPDTVAPGSYSKLTFRVPNESETASTTKLEIQLPQDTPFASVRGKAIPGWTVELTKEKLPAVITQGNTTIDEAVTTIVFTADSDADAIGLNQFGEFDIQVGPVPDVVSITFTAVQTYSDGKIVTWGDPTPAGGAEPAHPAPVLTVAGAATDGHGGHGAETDSATVEMAAAAGDGTARTLGIVGIVIGVIGLGVGVLGSARGRRNNPKVGS